MPRFRVPLKDGTLAFILKSLEIEEFDHMNLNPLDCDNEQIANYVAQSERLGDGAANPNYVDNLLQSIGKQEAFIERRKFGFAIIHRVLKVPPVIRPKIKVLSHYQLEVIEVFKGTPKKETKKFVEELIERYGTVADIRGDSVGRARARLFKSYGCEVVEKPKAPNTYDVVFRKIVTHSVAPNQ